MTAIRADVLILGSGFGGSLLSLILARRGLSVAIVDKAVHPRFAIGESSTPLANSTLVQVARIYDLPELLPLTKYGAWKSTRPETMCGLKRGFSYFGHHPGEAFRCSEQMVVAASSSDDHSDTQWLRSDVDALLFLFAGRRGAVQFEGAQYQLSRVKGHWRATGLAGETAFEIHAPFAVDGTGSAGELLRFHHIADQSGTLKTDSRAVFGHFADAMAVESVLDELDVDRHRHPFECGNAAVHHVLDNGWMWQLRFDDRTLSAGFVFDQRFAKSAQALPPNSAEAIWNSQLCRFPFLQRQFVRASVVRLTTGLRQTQRLQHLTTLAAGESWAALPGTAGFIDPLHSTGIAHTLFGVRRLAHILVNQSATHRPAVLAHYSNQLIDEIRLIDELVEGCYASLPNFALWCDWCMLYFAAATSMEQTTSERHDAGFLRADDKEFRGVLREARRTLAECVHPVDAHDADRSHEDFSSWLRLHLVPWNRVGLLNDQNQRMYTTTAAP